MFIVPESKIKSLAEVQRLVAEARAYGRNVVFGNGCFDLIHVGHIRYLREAKALGEILIVGLNSDAAVRALKGSGRPLQPQDERAEIVASLECVDYLVIFDALTAREILLAIRPDIHAKGTDYTSENVPERDTVASFGGRVEIVGDPKDHASRDLIRTIVERNRR
ncbi:MAG: D-beta-D-heptose 1-phosphate adenosyltransferase [Acidobacteria bacterium]|nr:D-beta-D-heptose 1-phosphate adenosyltransferase [Acidobacteriota bacterium]